MRFRLWLPTTLIALGCGLGWQAATAQDHTAHGQPPGHLDRTVLPPAAPEFRGKISETY